MRYLARVSYDGSQFQGFQRLNNGRGVQNKIEDVLTKVFHKQIEIKGAGRTDAGVHALDQCFHFDLDVNIAPLKLQYILNKHLSKYIYIQSLDEVSSLFHARYDVKEKTYLYKIYLGERDPFIANYACHITKDLDIKLMKECSKMFIGDHNFKNFVSGERDNYDSSIHNIIVREEDKYIYIEFIGHSFYRYMVRSMVGAIIQVGVGNVSLSEVKDALQNPSVKKTFLVAPPEGLYLTSILY